MIDQAQCDFNVNLKPTVLIDNCPPQDLNTNSYIFNWSATDPELDPLEYQTRLDMQAWSGWGTNTTLSLVGLGSGNHVFYVRVRDITGGTDQTQCNFRVNFGPSITITNAPSQDVNTISYTFQWNASDDLDSPLTMSYNVELDGAWQGWQPGILNYQWSALPSGSRTFKVRVRDTGNPALWAEDSCNFFVNFKPTVNIINCPIGAWPSSDITFNWTGIDDNTPEAGMSYSWKLDTAPWSPWQLGQLSAPYTGLAEGGHTFSVRGRDTGTPALTCETAPSTCGVCNFTIDSSCAFPPPDVQNFHATKADPTLNARQVRLTWDALPGCVDFYDIERHDYDWATGWQWVLLQTLPHPTTVYNDTNARYSGPASAIEYRIKARNAAGSSPAWSTDTGYPKMRNIHMALWCVSDDPPGTNPATPWSRGWADFLDCDDFWNDYGVNFVLQNAGDFFWITDPAYRYLTGGEDSIMHMTYGRATFPNSINVYYVESSNGNFGRGYCVCYCPGSNHNTQNVFVVLCRDTRGVPPNENGIVLAHECGHGAGRFWDQYLLDTNHNIIHDEPTTCALNDTWCTIPPNTPWLFCDDNSCYPENPGAAGKVPKQLMWYSFATPVSDYDISGPQWIWWDEWVHGNESNYPWP
jgi:hypothetical protein